MTPKATKHKSPDERSQSEREVKRAKLDVSDMQNAVQDEQVPEGVQQVENPNSQPTKPEAKRPRIKKLTPPRPFPTVPASVSATGPRSARSEGKNYICITRNTPLAAYLRRCKDVVLEDGWVASFLTCLAMTSDLSQGIKLCT